MLTTKYQFTHKLNSQFLDSPVLHHALNLVEGIHPTRLMLHVILIPHHDLGAWKTSAIQLHPSRREGSNPMRQFLTAHPLLVVHLHLLPHRIIHHLQERGSCYLVNRHDLLLMILATTISITSQPMPTRFHIVNSPSFPVEKMSMQGTQRSIAPNSMAAIMQCHKTFRTIVPMILVSLYLSIITSSPRIC